MLNTTLTKSIKVGDMTGSVIPCTAWNTCKQASASEAVDIEIVPLRGASETDGVDILEVATNTGHLMHFTTQFTLFSITPSISSSSLGDSFRFPFPFDSLSLVCIK
jgi:hypothetical protein